MHNKIFHTYQRLCMCTYTPVLLAAKEINLSGSTKIYLVGVLHASDTLSYTLIKAHHPPSTLSKEHPEEIGQYL